MKNIYEKIYKNILKVDKRKIYAIFGINSL